MLEAHDTDGEIDHMHELFSSIFDEEYPPEDLSAAEWLKQKVSAPAAHHVNDLVMCVDAFLQPAVDVVTVTPCPSSCRAPRPRCWLRLMHAMQTTGVRTCCVAFSAFGRVYIASGCQAQSLRRNPVVTCLQAAHSTSWASGS